MLGFSLSFVAFQRGIDLFDWERCSGIGFTSYPGALVGPWPCHLSYRTLAEQLSRADLWGKFVYGCLWESKESPKPSQLFPGSFFFLAFCENSLERKSHEISQPSEV